MGFIDRLKRAGQRAGGPGLARLLKTVTIYDQGGVPIIDPLDTVDEVSRKALEGGFLVAVTQFSSMKLADDDQMTTISFESKENGTFVVSRSQHFIASLLWRGDSGVPFEQAKEALTDLLRLLEKAGKSADAESVQRLLKDYVEICS
ncbi:MAG: hypothetical protein JW839_10575 [Candidatus Lokiarchaeota archaeon]|nr:hypothetical protein [Candidatus Lokiarchaeota archaeon]